MQLLFTKVRIARNWTILAATHCDSSQESSRLQIAVACKALCRSVSFKKDKSEGKLTNYPINRNFLFPQRREDRFPVAMHHYHQPVNPHGEFKKQVNKLWNYFGKKFTDLYGILRFKFYLVIWIFACLSALILSVNLYSSFHWLHIHFLTFDKKKNKISHHLITIITKTWVLYLELP